jgi:hypothetical protein
MKQKHFNPIHFIAFLLCLAVMQKASSQSVKVPLTLDRWDTVGVNATLETYLGKESILLKSGAMLVKGADLRDGIIEADISFPQQRGFPGIAFRVQDLNNFENFYVRPHQSGNPDATQYTPVFNSNAGWQLYHGEGFTKAVTYKFGLWHHIKIDIHGLQAEIYIDDMQTPIIKVKELMTGWKGGRFGFIAGGIPLRIANVEYTTKQGSAPVAIPVPATGTGGVITQWQVSNVFNRKLFEKTYQLTSAIKSTLKWTTERTDTAGTINLSKFVKLSDTTNAVIARVVIESQSDQVKALQFGFSDFVLVYLNDKALYSGADNFLSRDYRFLGTIGYFDRLFLPLKKGRNELWFVVSENFGGWGVKAKFENMDKIMLK